MQYFLSSMPILITMNGCCRVVGEERLVEAQTGLWHKLLSRLPNVNLAGHLNAYLTISAVEQEKEPCPWATNSAPSRLSSIRGRFDVAESVNFRTSKEVKAAPGGTSSSATTTVKMNV
jgi:hypothetical protein